MGIAAIAWWNVDSIKLVTNFENLEIDMDFPKDFGSDKIRYYFFNERKIMNKNNWI